MSNELKTKITRYRIAMSVAKSMLMRGIITSEEYRKIDTIMTEKYGVSSGTIFR